MYYKKSKCNKIPGDKWNVDSSATGLALPAKWYTSIMFERKACICDFLKHNSSYIR